MKEDRFVFAQLTDFLDRNHFNYLVRKYDGDKYVKHFTCWNQLLVLMFGQLSNRESLRDLIVALEAHHEKCYRLGLGKQATRSNLAKANENRDFRIFENFAYRMIDEARRRRVTDIFKLEGNVYAFDSTTIDLCLSVFEWAKFRTTKGGVKVHTMYDVETQVPAFVHITPAAVHDVKAMDVIPYEPGSFYIFDRGYNDFKRLYRIDVLKSFFVIRSKGNLKYKAVKWKRRLPENVLSDAEIVLTGYYPSKYYPERLRLIRYWDEEQGREFMFLTNAIGLNALLVAELYRNRWQIELFFYDKLHIMQSWRQSRIDIQPVISATSRFNFA